MRVKNPFTAGMENQSDDNNKVRTSVTASSRVYEEIRERIISLHMPPDTTLVRTELAQLFNVSQSPLREAIIRLEKDGLVISYPQSRTIVTKIDASKIRDEHFLRSAVECEVVRQLTLNADSRFITKAKGLVKMQSALVDDIEQVDLFMQLDEAFHEALFASVNQGELYQYISTHGGHLARLRSLDLPRTEKLDSVLSEHQAIIKAIEQGDVDSAVQSMRIHLSGTINRLPQIIEAHSDLFN